MRVLVYGMVGTNRGGIETFLLKMNQFMTQSTVFDYVIEEKKCIHENTIRERGGKIYYITKRTESAMKNICDNKTLLRDLRNTHEAVYFNLSSLSWIEPIRIAVKLGYRVYVHSHNAEFIEANSDFLHRITNAYNKKKLSHYHITRLTCSDLATKFMFNPDDQVHMVYNAIFTNQFRFNENTRSKVRKELGIKETEKLIGFVGRLNDQKNPLFLPEILKSVLEKRKETKMVILGEGRLKEDLVKKVNTMNLEDKCLIIGNKPNPSEYMHAMDIFVLPSLHEGLPYVGVEAQTAGLKCLLSDNITKEVDATGNVKFLPLLNTAENWAAVIISEFENEPRNREYWGDFMSETNFNIQHEALQLERILRR